MDELITKCFAIITEVGMARTCFVQAMEAAGNGQFDEADRKISEGNEHLTGGHTEHASLVTQEASGDHVEMNLFLVHAEDQLMSAETCRIMSKELIRVYRKLYEMDGEAK